MSGRNHRLLNKQLVATLQNSAQRVRGPDRIVAATEPKPIGNIARSVQLIALTSQTKGYTRGTWKVWVFVVKLSSKVSRPNHLGTAG